MNLKEYIFQFYPANIETKKPLGELSLYDLLFSIKNPREDIVELFEKIQEASKIGDKKLKAQLKSGLYYFNPCIYTDGEGRSYSNIKHWTGLMILDVDNLEPDFAIELKEHLFYTYPFIIASMLSSSRKGVKCIVKIPVVDSVESFKSYFYGLMDEFQHYKGIDPSCKNSALPFYLTYDRELLYRTDAIEWNRKGIQIDEFEEYDGEIIPVENVTEEDIRYIKNIIKKIFSNIVDNGHIPVRSASLLFGGYISAYGLNVDEMRDYLFELIEDTPYLQKSLRTYKTTANQMLQKGMLAPIYLQKDEK